MAPEDPEMQAEPDSPTKQLAPKWRAVYKGPSFKVSSLFPPLSWLPAYKRLLQNQGTEADQQAVGDLAYSAKGDFVAGLTVGLMLVPQCLAFALLAGLHVRAGLYSSVAPLILYALLGTLRQLQVGPTALISLLTGQALDAAGFLEENARMGGAAQLALLVGLISVLLGVLRFGFVVDFMSHSVMSSFCTASGIIIATSQLKHVLGVTMKRQKYWWQTVSDLVVKIPEIDIATAVLGFTLLAMLTFLKAWKRAGSLEKRSKSLIWSFFPKQKDSMIFKAVKLLADLSSVLCVLIGWIWGWIYRSTGVDSVKLIGESNSAGLYFQVPSLNEETVNLLVPAALIAIVGYLETIAVGGKMATEKRYKYDANQELLALGFANVAGAFMAGFPITGGFSRTAVNAMFGATSQLAGALTSIIVIFAIYFLMPVVELLPLSALAPLIIHGAIGVTDFTSFLHTFYGNKLDFAIMFLTLAVSLGLTVKEGLACGVALSILKLTYEVAMPNMAVCGQVDDGSFRDLRYYPEARMPSNCVVVRMDARLSFANSRRLQEFSLRAVDVAEAEAPVKFLVLDCKSVNGADMTGCEAIENLAISLKKRGKSLLLANLKAPFTKALFAAHIDQHLSHQGGHLCWNMEQAMQLASGGDAKVALESVQDLHSRVQADGDKRKSLPI